MRLILSPTRKFNICIRFRIGTYVPPVCSFSCRNLRAGIVFLESELAYYVTVWELAKPRMRSRYIFY